MSDRDPGELITFGFTVFDEAGQELGSNRDGNPNIVELGAGEMLPALERVLAEMGEKETCSIVLGPEDAYGPVRVEAFRELPLESIPEEARQVGRKVVGRAPDGAEDTFDVVEIREDTVVIDMNHPLAGQTLRFDLELLTRKPARSVDTEASTAPPCLGSRRRSR